MRRILHSTTYRCLLTAETITLAPPCLLSLRRHKFLFNPSDEDFLDPPFTPITQPNNQINKPVLNPITQSATKTRKKKKTNGYVKDPKPDKAENQPAIGSAPVQSSDHLPFDFRYSYSEADPAIRPIGFREPTRFSPFGPGRLDRKWTGVAAKVREVEPGAFEKWAKDKRAVLGDPLTSDEVEQLVERFRHSDCDSQINIGRGGVTHNMLDDIHNHWTRAEAVRIKCLGVPTLDIDNVCFHLEDKTGGKIIYRNVNILLLYRGRNYDPKNRPTIPLMLWKPFAAIYPRLVKDIAEGLTFEQTKEIRSRGLSSPALLKLSRNGVYVNVVDRVREAFETSDVVRLDCPYVGSSDCKKIAVKLRDLVPCIPVLIKNDQIVLWRGKRREKQ